MKDNIKSSYYKKIGSAYNSNPTKCFAYNIYGVDALMMASFYVTLKEFKENYPTVNFQITKDDKNAFEFSATTK